MKVGDRVKILAGDHSQEGEWGLIVEELKPSLDETPRYAWNFVVAMNGDKEDPIAFFTSELEVTK